MTKLTRYYSTLNICHDCYNDNVISYEIAYDPMMDGVVTDVCEICGKSAILLSLRNVTVLGRAKFKRMEKFKSKFGI